MNAQVHPLSASRPLHHRFTQYNTLNSLALMAKQNPQFGNSANPTANINFSLEVLHHQLDKQLSHHNVALLNRRLEPTQGMQKLLFYSSSYGTFTMTLPIGKKPSEADFIGIQRHLPSCVKSQERPYPPERTRNKILEGFLCLLTYLKPRNYETVVVRSAYVNLNHKPPHLSEHSLKRFLKTADSLYQLYQVSPIANPPVSPDNSQDN